MDNDSEILRDIDDIINPNTHVQMPYEQPQHQQPQQQPHILHLTQSSSSPAFVNVPPQQQQQQEDSPMAETNKAQKPYIKILEQPTSRKFRFRYLCEGRSAGSIPGANSTNDRKTYPTIEIVGCKGDVAIVVSCVTKDPPYRPHPHNLVGKEGCKHGVCTLIQKGDPLRVVFSNLGIQCVRKKDIEASLKVREAKKVDPFKTKFDHMNHPSSIDLNSVRLCFQAFLKTDSGHQALEPVVSDPIFKTPTELVISRLCSCSAKIGGGDEIILLCEKVAKDDIKVKFYEVENEQVTWEAYADFNQTDVHRQTAIAFRTPRYHSTTVRENAKIYIQLVRPSDGMTSEPKEFEYYPDPDELKRKRIRSPDANFSILRTKLQNQGRTPNTQIQNEFSNILASFGYADGTFEAEIKPEPVFLDADTQNSNSNGSTMNTFLDPMRRASSSSGGSMIPLSALQGNAIDMPHQQQQTSPLNGSMQMPTQFLSQLPPMPNFIGAASYSPLQTQHTLPANGMNIPAASIMPDYQLLMQQTQTQSVPQMQQQTLATDPTNNYMPWQTDGMSMHCQPQQLHQQQQHQQQQNMEYTQLQNVSDVLANINGGGEAPTLSGLLNEIDFDDLPLSNLSIHERTIGKDAGNQDTLHSG